ncbi:tetratricopeptide repeat protein [Clostridium tertium]
MIKALEYTELDSNKIRNYLYLSTLYKLTNEFDLALEYTVNALEIAMELKDDALINACLINLGENYYIKRNYTKTIDIYEQLIEEYRLENTNNIIDVYGYLAYCYAKKGDYTNYQMYKEKYLNIANESNSIGDLIWLYSNCAELEADFNNLDIAKEYLNKVQDLYDNNSDKGYANIDIVLEYSQEKINYLENKDYDNTIKTYKNILEELNNRGVKSDIRDSIIKEILTISYEEGDYETFIEYINAFDNIENNEESQVYTDRIVTKMNNTIKEKEVLRTKMGASILFIATIVSISGLISSKRKNN